MNVNAITYQSSYLVVLIVLLMCEAEVFNIYVYELWDKKVLDNSKAVWYDLWV